MRKILNILFLVFTLLMLIALAVYCAYEHYHDNLKDVNLKIVRKTESVPPTLWAKLSRTLGKMVNEGKGGFFCILL